MQRTSEITDDKSTIHSPEGTITKTLKTPFTKKKYIVTFSFVVSLFMLWGVSMTMGDVLNRHFQSVLHISKSKSGLVQFSMFGAYAVMAIPAGLFMKKYGYKKGVLLGLLLYASGAFLFVPAANAESFTFFRVALFVLACGLATLETVAHPFITILGSQHSSERRLNFAQGFNGLGGVMGSFLGGYFILRAGVEHSNDLDSVKLLYQLIGCVILVVAIAFIFLKVPPITDTNQGEAGTESIPFLTPMGETKHVKKLFQHKHFISAIAAQFFCVAIQGGTWAFLLIMGLKKWDLQGRKQLIILVSV